jgi:cytochrome P450
MRSRLLEARSPEGEIMSLGGLRAEITTTLLAGFDTTSTTSCGIIIHALRSPATLAKILAEFRNAREHGLLSPIPQQAEVLEHLPYYVACVRESMRLEPSVQSIFPRQVMPEQTLVLEGKVVPIGTEVACNPWITHRDHRIYGADAELYRPERWLENGGESGKFLDKYYLGLGYGSRVCMGRDLAMMELLKFPLMVSVPEVQRAMLTVFSS